MGPMKRTMSVAAATLVMASGIGLAGATQASARECHYPTRSCNWEPTAQLCEINGNIVRQLKKAPSALPEPYKSRFKRCVSWGWPSRG